MLSNSMTAAALATSYVIALVLHLNPSLPINPARLAPIVSTIGLFYFVHLAAIAYVLLVLRQLLAREVFSPAWISVDVLTWLGTMAAAAGAALMWRNLNTFSLVLDEATASALDRSAAALATAAALLALVALCRAKAPHAKGWWAALLVLVAAGSAVAPLAVRGRGAAPLLEARPIDTVFAEPRTDPSPRVTVIAIDAASLDLITRATAEGRLPNFGRILDAGAVRYLATLHPTSAEAVWAAVATGKLPQKNGVRSTGMYQIAGGGGALQLLPDYCFAHGLERFGFLVEQAHSSATLRTRTLWSIVSTSGYSVGVVGWPLTTPAPPVRGYLVSDTYYRVALTAYSLDDPSAIYPADLQTEALAAMEAATAETPPVVNASLGAAGGDGRQEGPARIDRVNDRIAH